MRYIYILLVLFSYNAISQDSKCYTTDRSRKEWFTNDTLSIEKHTDSSIDILTIGNISPNPSKTSITIVFKLTEPMKLKIEISDITGKIITNLLNRYMESGKSSITGNLVTDSGVKLSSGRYFVRFTGRNISKSVALTIAD